MQFKENHAYKPRPETQIDPFPIQKFAQIGSLYNRNTSNPNNVNSKLILSRYMQCHKILYSFFLAKLTQLGLKLI